MQKRYRLLMFAALITALSAPLWLTRSFEFATSIAKPFDLLVVPTAAAAVLIPVVIGDGASASIPQQRFDAAGLVMVGTVLFGLASVVRRTL